MLFKYGEDCLIALACHFAFLFLNVVGKLISIPHPIVLMMYAGVGFWFVKRGLVNSYSLNLLFE